MSKRVMDWINVRLCAVAQLALWGIGCGNNQSPAPPVSATVTPPKAVAPVVLPPSSPPSASAAPARSTEIQEAKLFYFEPKDLIPHRVESLLGDLNDIQGTGPFIPYLSDDGKKGVVFVYGDLEERLQIMQLRSLDGTAKDVDIPLLNYHCEMGDPSRCDRKDVERQVKKVNKVLLKHRWVQFKEYVTSLPETSANSCGGEELSRHFHLPGYEVIFHEPHLRIVRDDGAVIVDRDYMFHDPSEPERCKQGVRPYVESIGVDEKRRAMFAGIRSCDVEGCRDGDFFFFYRLPPPLPKKATR